MSSSPQSFIGIISLTLTAFPGGIKDSNIIVFQSKPRHRKVVITSAFRKLDSGDNLTFFSQIDSRHSTRCARHCSWERGPSSCPGPPPPFCWPGACFGPLGRSEGAMPDSAALRVSEGSRECSGGCCYQSFVLGHRPHCTAIMSWVTALNSLGLCTGWSPAHAGVSSPISAAHSRLCLGLGCPS